MSINSGPNPYPTSYSDPYSQLNYQPEPRKNRPVSRRVFLGRVGVGVLGAGLLVSAGYRAGLLGTDEERREARRRLQHQRYIDMEPKQQYDYQKDLGKSSRLLIYTAYERNGRYIPATEKHAAQNVPYPVLHPGMNKYTRSGLYTFIAYYYASLKYFYLTGDTEPLSKIVKPEDVIEPEILRFYQEKRGWLICEDDIFNEVSINSGSFFPDERFEYTKRNIFYCSVEYFLHRAAYFFISGTGEKIPLDHYETFESGYFSSYLENLKGRWVLINNGKDLMPLCPPGFHKIRY